MDVQDLKFCFHCGNDIQGGSEESFCSAECETAACGSSSKNTRQQPNLVEDNHAFDHLPKFNTVFSPRRDRGPSSTRRTVRAHASIRAVSSEQTVVKGASVQPPPANKLNESSLDFSEWIAKDSNSRCVDWVADVSRHHPIHRPVSPPPVFRKSHARTDSSSKVTDTSLGADEHHLAEYERPLRSRHSSPAVLSPGFSLPIRYAPLSPAVVDTTTFSPRDDVSYMQLFTSIAKSESSLDDEVTPPAESYNLRNALYSVLRSKSTTKSNTNKILDIFGKYLKFESDTGVQLRVSSSAPRFERGITTRPRAHTTSDLDSVPFTDNSTITTTAPIDTPLDSISELILDPKRSTTFNLVEELMHSAVDPRFRALDTHLPTYLTQALNGHSRSKDGHFPNSPAELSSAPIPIAAARRGHHPDARVRGRSRRRDFDYDDRHWSRARSRSDRSGRQ